MKCYLLKHKLLVVKHVNTHEYMHNTLLFIRKASQFSSVAQSIGRLNKQWTFYTERPLFFIVCSQNVRAGQGLMSYCYSLCVVNEETKSGEVK